MNQRNLSSFVLLADLVWSALAMSLAVLFRYGTEWSHNDVRSMLALQPFLATTWVIWTFLSLLLPLDGFRGGWRLSAVFSQLLLSVSVLMLILLAGGYLLRSYVSRLVLIHFGLLVFIGFVLVRVSSYVALRARSRNGFARRVVIVGRGRLGRELARKIHGHPEMLCKVVGFLETADATGKLDAPQGTGGAVTNIPVLGVVDLLCQHQVDELMFADKDYTSRDVFNLTAACRNRGIAISVVPQSYELYLSRSHLLDLDGLPVLQLARPDISSAAVVHKRMVDFVLGCLFTLLAIPIIGLLAFALYWRKRKVFRWETRCGYRGHAFSMLRLNVERCASNPSRFERVLSALSLTELPQLWNVLRGEMSLVGPRPESFDRVCHYSEWQQKRLNVKPGITGLAQVQGLREQHTTEEKARFDLQYLLNPSPWTDLSLLLQTMWTLATRGLSWQQAVGTPELAKAPADPMGPPVQSEIF